MIWMDRLRWKRKKKTTKIINGHKKKTVMNTN